MSSSNQSYIDMLSMDPKVLGNKALSGGLIWLGLDYAGLTNYIVNTRDSSVISAAKMGAWVALSDSLGATLRKTVPQLKCF